MCTSKLIIMQYQIKSQDLHSEVATLTQSFISGELPTEAFVSAHSILNNALNIIQPHVELEIKTEVKETKAFKSDIKSAYNNDKQLSELINDKLINNPTLFIQKSETPFMYAEYSDNVEALEISKSKYDGTDSSEVKEDLLPRIKKLEAQVRVSKVNLLESLKADNLV